MREKTVESYLRDHIKSAGGIAIKLASTGARGDPDRLILMPGGRAYFIETKTIGGTVSKIQRRRLEKLRKLGFEADVIWTSEQAKAWIEEHK